MMRCHTVARVLAVSAVGLFLELTAAGTVSALNPVVGTVQVNGPVWVADQSDDWGTISSTRPMVVGDSYRTGEDGYLLADLGVQGVFGMYGNTQIDTIGSGDSPQIDVSAGKIAFHLSAGSDLIVSVADAELMALGPRTGAGVDAYVEINDNGDAVVSVEHGSLNVRSNGVDRRIDVGERYLLKETAMGAQDQQLAAVDEEAKERDKAAGLVTEEDDDSDAGGAPLGAGGAGEIGVGEVAVGVAIVGGGAAALSGGSSGDSNGSP